MFSRHEPYQSPGQHDLIPHDSRGKSFGASSSRLMHVDTVRGLLLVFMAVNHIASDLRVVTDHPLGFMSAAEGFVFMAGLMAGYVYTRTWLRGNFADLQQTCRSRAVSIYRWHVATYVLVLAGLVVAGFSGGSLPANSPAALLSHPVVAVFTGALLVYQPTLFDILPLYCVLLLVTPWCLRICAARSGYARLISGSLALWGVTNIFCPQAPFENSVINTGAFNLGAWQVIYITGLAFGHRWAQRQASRHKGDVNAPVESYLLSRPSAPLITGLIALAVLLFCVRHGFLPSGLSEHWLATLSNKNNLAPLRLLDTALIVYLGYLLISRFPQAFSWRPLAWMGRASLTVFSAHVVAAYAIQASPEFFMDTSGGRWLGTALMLLTLVLAAAVHDRFLPKKSSAPRIRPGKPPLQTRQPRLRRFIVRHEPRPSVPADSFHRRSR